MSARDENEFEVQVQCHQAGEITYVCYSPCPARKELFASYEHLPALYFSLEEFVRLKQGKYFAACTDDI